MEGVRPEIDCGAVPAKRTVGELVAVEADIFTDGHVSRGGEILSRFEPEEVWRRSSMKPVGIDRWGGDFLVSKVGKYCYTIEGWIDRFRTRRNAMIKRLDSGVHFAVGAPDAVGVPVVGDHNRWDPRFRIYLHNTITFSLLYAFPENFVLPLSHDEVVYGKGSMIAKMPGDEWQKFASLQLLCGYISFHSGLRRWVRDLNTFYRGQPSLFEADFDASGFEWVDCSDAQRSVVCFLRRGGYAADVTLFACNFTQVPRDNYRVGVPYGSPWREVLNGDAPVYDGSGQGNEGGVAAIPLPVDERPYSLDLTLPPLGIVVFKPELRR